LYAQALTTRDDFERYGCMDARRRARQVSSAVLTADCAVAYDLAPVRHISAEQSTEQPAMVWGDQVDELVHDDGLPELPRLG
jgi:hypothetical protein